MMASSGTPISPTTESQARRQPLIVQEGDKARIGEFAGGAAAECAAVCCCCPCALVSFLVLAVVRLPAGLCRRAIRRRKRKRKKAAVGTTVAGSTDDDESAIHRRVLIDSGGMDSLPSMSPSEEEAELEKEMWARFYGAGFWRSPSQRE